MRYPSREELETTFDQVACASFCGVEGVIEIKGRQPGQRFLLSAMTHGNELSGLAAVNHLLKSPDLPNRLRGSILVVVNNILAGRRYFEASGLEERLRCRFVDHNMNRLPEGFLDSTGTTDKYELKRATQLAPIMAEADFGLDLHSTPYPSPPLVIDIKGKPEELDTLSDGIAIGDRITNIAPLAVGYSIGELYGGLNREVPVIEVESGMHEDLAALRVAIHAAVATLMKVGMLEGASRELDGNQNVYRTCDTVLFPDLSYRLSRSFGAFESIVANTVIASGDGEPIVARNDCHNIFERERMLVDERLLDEEVLFLSEPVRRRHRKFLIPID